MEFRKPVVPVVEERYTAIFFRNNTIDVISIFIGEETFDLAENYIGYQPLKTPLSLTEIFTVFKIKNCKYEDNSGSSISFSFGISWADGLFINIEQIGPRRFK